MILSERRAGRSPAAACQLISLLPWTHQTAGTLHRSDSGYPSSPMFRPTTSSSPTGGATPTPPAPPSRRRSGSSPPRSCPSSGTWWLTPGSRLRRWYAVTLVWTALSLSLLYSGHSKMWWWKGYYYEWVHLGQFTSRGENNRCHRL